LREILDKRTHSYATLPIDYPQISGNFRQVRQALKDRRESRAAGGDNERGLAPHEFPQGFARRIPKPTKEQFDQWRFEEPALLRKLQGGDYGAAALLAERYRWSIQNKASRAVRKVSGGLYFGDVFGCALVRFCECLKEFKPGSNNGLMAYLTKAIDGAISDAQHDWQRKGFASLDTRLRRFLRNEDNREMPLEEIQKLFPKYTLEQIALAQEPIVMQSYGEGAVDDENGHQDADDHNAPSGYAVAAASADPVNAQRSTSSQWSKRAALGAVIWLQHTKRNVVAYETVDSARLGLGGQWSYRRKRVYSSPWVDSLERQAAARDANLLKGMGLQRFTEWHMDRRSTANTGDWENGEWRSAERKARLLSTTARIQRSRADWNTWEEIEAKEAEKRPRQDFSSFWNTRSQKHSNKQTKLEAWQEKRDLSRQDEQKTKNASLAHADAWLRRYPAADAALTKYRGHTPSDLATLAKTHTERIIPHGPSNVARGNVPLARKRA
jgi:hypothetical protein